MQEEKECNKSGDKDDDFTSELRSKLGLSSNPQITNDVGKFSPFEARKSDKLLEFEQEMLENDEGFCDLFIKREDMNLGRRIVRFLPGKEGIFKIDERIALGKVGYGRDFVTGDSSHIHVWEMEEHPTLDRSIIFYCVQVHQESQYWIAMVYKGMIIDRIQAYISNLSKVLYKVKNDVYFLTRFATSPKENLEARDDSRETNSFLAKISLESFSIQFFELEFPYPECHSIAGNRLIWVIFNGAKYFIGKSTLQGKTTAKTTLFTRRYPPALTLFSSEKTLVIALDYSTMNNNLQPEIIILPFSLQKIEKIVKIGQNAYSMNFSCGLFIEGGFVWTRSEIFEREVEFWAVVTEGEDLGRVLCRKFDHEQGGWYVGVGENKFIVSSICPSDKVTLLTPSLI